LPPKLSGVVSAEHDGEFIAKISWADAGKAIRRAPFAAFQQRGGLCKPGKTLFD
jgi:hypothetical protein